MQVTKQLIEQAAENISAVVNRTPLQFNKHLSDCYDANVYVKREDLQEVRSFKIRGSYNRISSLNAEERERGIVCASAGNHAQGVAWSCNKLKINGAIFMPAISPAQKVNRVKMFGGEYVTVHLIGNNFDEAVAASQEYAKEHNLVYVHAFNDPMVIAGQGTIAKEVYEKLEGKIDYVVACVGGGGLISGISTYMKETNPEIKVIGSEPAGAAEMTASLAAGELVTLDTIDTFVDGASMKRASELTLSICQKYVDRIVTIDEGQVCKTMIDLYQNEGIIAEPAGALAIAALDHIKDEIKGKTVVCTLSGGNNDILRYPEVIERSLVWQGLKHYFIVNFAQKPGQLKLFLEQVLGPHDDIVRFEYIKKTNKETGPALIGLELQNADDLQPLMERMIKHGIPFRRLTTADQDYQILV